MYTILIADDEPIMLVMVEKLLKKEGYNVVKTTSAQGVYDLLDDETPDLFLIDINLPDQNGLSLCRELRASADFSSTPMVFLTSTSPDPDEVARALNAGGDDYIHKPFAARELSARIRAQLRRVRVQQERNNTHLTLNHFTHMVSINGERDAELTKVEFNLLQHMCQTPNTWKTTRDLLAEVWRYPGNIGDAALVRNHIRNIRRKIEENPDHPKIIVSRHRRGYLVAAKVDIAEDVV